MKKLIAPALLAVALLVGVASAGGGPAPPPFAGETTFEVDVLEPLGGTSSVGFSINNRGWVAGRSNLAGNQRRHATLWRDGKLTDLETLGGPNSAVLWPVKNVRGIVSGIAQTDEPDPYNEPWSCGFFFPAATRVGVRCLGFRWMNGEMTALRTLGGTHGFATGTNNRGQTVGWAETTVEDPTCVAPQRFEFHAVMWGPPPHAEVHELLPLPGDSASAATAINDRGQVVGISGICDQAVGRFSAVSAVLWENGEPTEIGDFGGVAWNTPMAINRSGAVVGFANASAADGGNLNPLPFLWTAEGGVEPLDLLPGHVTGQATGINSWGQIVGQSCDPADECRAVLWNDGAIEDLNELAPGNDDLLTTANDIDDSGRITGQGFDADGNRFVAFLATPTTD